MGKVKGDYYVTGKLGDAKRCKVRKINNGIVGTTYDEVIKIAQFSMSWSCGV